MLARFRADPSRVRVAIRRVGGEWMATVKSREEPGELVEDTSPDPVVAVNYALSKAVGCIRGVYRDVTWDAWRNR